MNNIRGGSWNAGLPLIATDDVGGVHFPKVKIQTGDSPSIDAFGRWRVSSPQTVFDSKVIHDTQTLRWDDAATSGAGTGSSHNSNQASVTISVGNTTAGTRVRQSRRRIQYQPGKSQLVFQTFVLGAAATGITRRVGLFDANNGIFLQQTVDGLSIVRRTKTSGSPDDTSVDQDDWNIDSLDGSGASAITLDETAAQILVIDFEWLGVGRVRVGFVIDGAIYYVHQFLNANNLSLVYMSTPNLPVRYEISNSGAGAAASLRCICASVQSEGGQTDAGIVRSADRAATGLTTLDDADLYPLIAIRLNSSYLDAAVGINGIEVLCTSTATYRWAVLLNPTVAGTALTYSQISNSAVDAAAGATNATKVSGGSILASGYGTSGNQSKPTIAKPAANGFFLGSSISGTADVIVLAAQRITGTTETFYGAVSWTEVV